MNRNASVRTIVNSPARQSLWSGYASRAACIVLMLWLTTLCSAAPATRPATSIPVEGCVTDACHSRLKAFTVVHGPVASNTCDACHDLSDPVAHTFKVNRDKADLCTYCHGFSTAGMPVVHKPVAEGQCLGCHDPHGGETRAIIREASPAELCNRCHESMTKGRSVLHGPVAAGACDSCHPPHASRFPKLLDAAGTDLCLTCHKELEPRLARAKVKHQAMKDGCEKCHDVHGSNVALSLLKPVDQLCIECHKPIAEKISHAVVPHSPVTQGRACITCHTPHAGDFAKLTIDSPAVLCLKCHDKSTKAKDGREIAAVKQIADPKLIKHGELKDGQCGGCHTSHGGPNQALLQKPYSNGFYQKFDPANFELCFSCHDAKLATDQETTVTGFRNGSRNLHRVHASEGNRDKNCRACHVIHAGPNSRLVRDTLHYGTWDMPVRFIKSETGGSCFPGCHRELAYDRTTPVPVPTTGPTTGPTTRIESLARAEFEDAQFVTWNITDDRGRAVHIPDPARPSLVVFVQENSTEAAAMLKEIGQIIPADLSVQVTVVASGAFEGPAIATLKSATPDSWSLVIDPRNDAADTLGVRGRPLVLVLRTDGSQVVRLSARPSVLTMKLRPYLELAAGRLAPLPPVPPTTHPAVEDPAKQLARNLRVVHRLIDEQKPQEALNVLEQLDRADRTAPPARCAEAKALIRIKRSAEALRVLDSIGKVRNTSPEEVIVRAEAWMSLNEWRQARLLLEQNVKQIENSAQGRQLLGQVYAHDQDWQQAAEQYRKAGELLKQ